MRRRDFILLGSAAATWPRRGHAQQATMPVVGFLNSASPSYAAPVRAFREGLKETGYVEGQNVTIEYRWAEGPNDRLPALAADLVRRQVNVAAANSSAVSPAKAATTTIPIVFTTSLDPVQSGLVASLSRPGGNVTGATSMNVEVGPKQLQVLHEAVPGATDFALLLNPTNANAEGVLRNVQAAVAALGLKLHILRASSEREIDAAFATSPQLRAGGLVIGVDAYLNSRNDQLAALALRHTMPTISTSREFVEAGGLMTYGTSVGESYRLMGIYVGRVLKGAKPAELPIQQSTKVGLIINLKTAKALGLTVPPTLLARADEVIE